MALVHADRVEETSTTTGTGTYNLGGATVGFRTFVAGIATTNTCYYCVTDGTDWEIGLGTVTDATPDTLARTRILASSNSHAAVNWAAGTRRIFCMPTAARPKDIAPVKGMIWDLNMSNAADTVNDITVAAGEATDETGEVVMVLPSAITKQLDANWAVGNNAGGLNTGAKANSTWYEVHLIMRQDTGVVDVMFSTTANRGTLPANYTHQRRIGWIQNNAAPTILQFTQNGDYVTLAVPINDNSVTLTVTAAPITLTAPPGSIARFRATTTWNTSVNAALVVAFKEVDAEDGTAPNDTTGLGSLGFADIAGGSAGHFELRVNASSQIEHDADAATGSPTFDTSIFGWIDDRRRFRNA